MFQGKFLKLRMSFRKWMRNRTRPLTIAEAEENKSFWAKVYFLSSFLAFGLTTAAILSKAGENNVSMTLPLQKRFLTQMKDDEQVRVIKISGFKKTADVLTTKSELFEKGDVTLLAESSSQAQQNSL